jgi:trk system potassium uptake protein TrkH
MRYAEYSKYKYAGVLHHTGTLLLGVGLYLLLPLIILLSHPQDSVYALSFLCPSLVSIAAGVSLRLIGRGAREISLDLAEGGVIVFITWTAAMVLSAFPFHLCGLLSFRSSLFESVSGWTTTGLSVVDVSRTPEILLMWRSLMQFAGGAGFAIVMLSAILGPHGRGLYQAEGRTEQLLPNVKRSARMVMMIYGGYTAAGILLYTAAGMTPFDSINHSLCALSTGGFSTRVASIGSYNSAFIEIVTMVLMLLGATNFATHYVMLRGKFRALSRSGELRITAVLLAVFAPIVLTGVMSPLCSFARAVRVSLFQTVSALSTTGYSTVPFSDWPDLNIACLVVLMLVGGGICSTAGGIKQYRIYVLVKSVVWEIKSHLVPRTAVQENYIWRGENKFYVPHEHMREIGVFFFIYMSTYIIGVLVFLAYGYPFRESLFEFASALGTVGLSTGLTQAGMPSGILWTEIAGMFLGRLEFFVVIYSLVKIIRDITGQA